MIHVITYGVLFAAVLIMADVLNRKNSESIKLNSEIDALVDRVELEESAVRNLRNKKEELKSDLRLAEKERDIYEQALDRVDPQSIHIDFVRNRNGKQVPYVKANRATIEEALERAEKLR